MAVTPTQLLLALLAAAASTVAADPAQQFHYVNGSLCINGQFTETHGASSDRVCATLCSGNQRCQAFSTADGPCQLFVFDKCSKSVRNCSCSRRGPLFLKRQPGLEAGALCPSGYGDELCGVKYRILNTTESWTASRQRCESQPGLTIMADLMDAAEMEHMEKLYNASRIGGSLWLGGAQLPGSPEPAGGWVWASCGGAISPGLWAAGEPTNSGGAENVTARYNIKKHVTDFSEHATVIKGVLCECLSPFT